MPKILAVTAIALSVISALLLWRFTPGGFGFPAYMNAESIEKQKAVNRRMVFWQRTAFVLLVLGAVMQACVLLY